MDCAAGCGEMTNLPHLVQHSLAAKTALRCQTGEQAAKRTKRPSGSRVLVANSCDRVEPSIELGWLAGCGASVLGFVMEVGEHRTGPVDV